MTTPPSSLLDHQLKAMCVFMEICDRVCTFCWRSVLIYEIVRKYYPNRKSSAKTSKYRGRARESSMPKTRKKVSARTPRPEKCTQHHNTAAPTTTAHYNTSRRTIFQYIIGSWSDNELLIMYIRCGCIFCSTMYPTKPKQR